MKRILSFFLCLFLLGSVMIPVFANEMQSGVLELLSELSIMQGDPDGNMRLSDAVTRAEFTKAAIASSAYRNSVASNLSISPFPDVTYQHWAAPYVRVGVTNGLISGYPDATFRPDDGVLFEEGVTIMLRILGYTDSDFGVSWPYGQIGMANNLEMTKNMDITAGQVMNRGQVAQLIYNTLSAKTKGQNSQLAAEFDVQIQDDVTLIADSKDDASIASDEVFTSSGTLKIKDGFDRSLLGQKGEAAIKNGNKLLSFTTDSSGSPAEDYVVYSVLQNTVMAYRNKTLSQVTIDDNATTYKGKNQTTFGAVKSSLEMGDILRVKRNGSEIDSITCQKGNLEGPVTVHTSGFGASWGLDDTTTVMRNGERASLSLLQNYDIAYYLPDLNLVLAYSDKVTGVYEKAMPNKDMPSSVTISGKEYELEGGDAFKKLSSGGSYSLGDTVTALLGKDGRIADVITATAAYGGDVVGYITESGRKTFQSGTVDTYTGYYVKIVTPEGKTAEYTTAKDYSGSKNKVAKITISGGDAKVSVISSVGKSKISGTFSWNAKKLGSYAVASDAAILDIGTSDAYSAGIYATVFPQRLDQVKINAEQVLYYDTDSTGAINRLILKNVTNDGYSFGLMTAASGTQKTVSGSYQYLVDGQLYALSTNGRSFGVSAGNGIMIGGNLNNPDSISKLSTVSEAIKGITASKLTTASTSYPISSNVSVYRKSTLYDADYVKIPITDIIGGNERYAAYYDKLPSSGGQIRVIVVY